MESMSDGMFFIKLNWIIHEQINTINNGNKTISLGVLPRRLFYVRSWKFDDDNYSNVIVSQKFKMYFINK